MASATEEPKPSEFRLTGRHVLAILIGAFGVVFAVNGYMLYRAVSTFPGTVTESSYRDSQRFNAEIAAARAQAERGWKVTATAERSPEGRVAVRIDARDRDGRPISGVGFRATLEHPAKRSLDHSVRLVATAGADGRFEGLAEGLVEPGKWDLVLEGDGAEGRVFLSHNVVVLH